MDKCPHCQAVVDFQGEHNFCSTCQRQFRCTSCRNPLSAGNTICLVCGTAIVLNQACVNTINRYSFEEETTQVSSSRKIELVFSDNAIEKVTSIFGNLNSNLPLPLVPTYSHMNPILSVKEPAPTETADTKSLLPPKAGDYDELGLEKSSVKSNILLDLFSEDANGVLLAQIRDFKGRTYKDQQERFILLYTKAYVTLKNEPIPSRKHFNEAAKANHLYDNLNRYLPIVTRKYLTNSSNTFTLNKDGLATVEQLLDELNDDTLEEGYQYWQKTTRRKKRASISKEEKTSLETWLSKDSQLDGLDKRQLEPIQWALIAVYDLTIELKVVSAVKPGLAYEYTKKRYETIPLSSQAFKAIFGRLYNRDKFTRTNDGSYHLTPQAETIVRDMISRLTN